jgi:NAD(P)-dependent dehydrogenase (short-subunit alcohol dehydrogenase family)
MTSIKPLKGKTAIVTGASKNLGAGSARELAAMGADVLVHYFSDKSKAEAEKTAQVIMETGSKAVLFQADLRQVANILRLFETAIQHFGKVDILVNTIGTMLKKPAVDVSEEEFDQMFAVHAKASFFLFREAARRLQDEGRIIHISSSTTVAILTGYYHVYAGAKAAAEQFTKMIAREVGSRRITVNSILPGALNTSFFYPVEDEHSIAWAKSMGITNRLGEVNDVIPLVSFLATPEAGWITAQSIRVNGGY